MRRYLVSVDIAMRTADNARARQEFVTFLHNLGLETSRSVEVGGYEKGIVNSRVFSTVEILALDFSSVIDRLRRLDAAIFDRSPRSPSRYFKLLRGEPRGVEIVGPSPDDPLSDPQIVWVNVEAEDSEAWQERLARRHDSDRSDRSRR
jgi:hypothetical protein